MKAYCIAYGCLNNHKDPGITFFTLPKDLMRRRKWLILLDRRDLLEKEVLKKSSYLVCSAHFDESSMKIVKYLKKDSLPLEFFQKKTEKFSSYLSVKKSQNASSYLRDKKDVTLLSNKITKEGSTSSEVPSISTRMKDEQSTAKQTLTSKLLTEKTSRKRKLSNELRENDIPRRLSCTECSVVLDARELYRCVQCPLVVMCADCGRSNKHLHHCVLRMPNIQVYNKVELLFETLVDIFNKKLDGRDDEDSTEETDQSDSIIKPVTESLTGSSQQPAGYLTIRPGEPYVRLTKIKTEPQAEHLTTPVNLPSSPITTCTEEFNAKKRKAQSNDPNKDSTIANVNNDQTSDKMMLVVDNIKVEIEVEENELNETTSEVDLKVEPPDQDDVL